MFFMEIFLYVTYDVPVAMTINMAALGSFHVVWEESASFSEEHL
jgi:hypothetical protein